jgi:hypothetical protein
MASENSKITKTCATGCLLIGSLLAYVFVLKIFARIWDKDAYLQHQFVAIFSGVFIWGGVRQWSRWRMPLGIIWTMLGCLAFLNSTQYESLRDLPAVPGFRTGPEVMKAMSNASVLMGIVALTLGIGLIVWQRLEEQRPAAVAA